MLYTSIRDFERIAGSTAAARLAFSGTSIHKTPHSGVVISGKTYQVVTYGTDIYFDANHFNQKGHRKGSGTKIGTVHELAHVWANKISVGAQSLDLYFDKYVADEPEPTWYAESNFSEDWAESVAMYVYPVYETILRKENKPNEMSRRNGSGPGLGILHKIGVSMFFESLRVNSTN